MPQQDKSLLDTSAFTEAQYDLTTIRDAEFKKWAAAAEMQWAAAEMLASNKEMRDVAAATATNATFRTPFKSYQTAPPPATRCFNLVL